MFKINKLLNTALTEAISLHVKYRNEQD